MAVFALVTVMVALAGVGCASFQRRLIYFPPIFDTATAERLGQAAGLERWLDRNGQPIGWKREAPIQPAQGRVLIVHGNAGAAVQCAHYADAIQNVVSLDVFMLEYPGYGDRPGKPSERSLEKSAVDALNFLSGPGPVYVVGESLGTGVAAYLAGTCPDLVAGLILLAPYGSLTDVAQAHVPYLLPRVIMVDRFPAGKFLRNFNGPVAVLVGGEDRVVPAKFGRRLFDGYDGPKRLWEFPNADHGTVMFQTPEKWREIIGFMLKSGE
jgi:hypothetical protein